MKEQDMSGLPTTKRDRAWKYNYHHGKAFQKDLSQVISNLLTHQKGEQLDIRWPLATESYSKPLKV